VVDPGVDDRAGRLPSPCRHGKREWADRLGALLSGCTEDGTDPPVAQEDVASLDSATVDAVSGETSPADVSVSDVSHEDTTSTSQDVAPVADTVLFDAIPDAVMSDLSTEDRAALDAGGVGDVADVAETAVPDPDCPSYALEDSVVFSAGSQVHWVSYDNGGVPSERKVTLVAPDGFDADLSYALVFMFHGSGGGDGGHINPCKGAQAAGHQVLCVVPLGGPQDGEEKPGWNLGGGQTGEDDVALVHGIWAGLQGEPYIDHDTVFALGTSMGSAFVGNILTNQACSFFTAVVQSATQLWVETVIESPVSMSVLMVHGENDGLIPIDGGLAFGTTNLLSVNPSLETWATHNGCVQDGQPLETLTEEYTRVQYADCSVPMVLYRLNGQGHGTSIQAWSPKGLLQLSLQIFVEGLVA
jgi:poly(3-hydroxybutyrate) depolymerase